MKIQTDAELDPTEKSRLMGEWELHKRRAERAYQQLKEDTALCQSDPTMEMLTFDLEQSLPTPVLTTNIVFYKRQLSSQSRHTRLQIWKGLYAHVA